MKFGKVTIGDLLKYIKENNLSEKDEIIISNFDMECTSLNLDNYISFNEETNTIDKRELLITAENLY